jgi:hypothetical protein
MDRHVVASLGFSIAVALLSDFDLERHREMRMSVEIVDCCGREGGVESWWYEEGKTLRAAAGSSQGQYE